MVLGKTFVKGQRPYRTILDVALIPFHEMSKQLFLISLTRDQKCWTQANKMTIIVFNLCCQITDQRASETINY